MNKKDIFVSTIKGIITGIATLIPGVNTAAIILSVSAYDSIIESIHNISKKNNKVLLFVTIPFIVGLFLGLIGGFHLIDYLWSKFRPQTILLVVGLVVGGIRVVFVKHKLPFNKKTVSLFIIMSTLFVVLYYLLKDVVILSKTNTISNIIILGIITGFSVLIPGTSLFTLKVKDNYNYMIDLCGNLTNFSNVISLFVFCFVSLIIIILISKTIYKLIDNNKKVTYLVLCSLMLVSIVISLLQLNSFKFSFVTVFTSILAFLWGYIFSKNVERE